MILSFGQKKLFWILLFVRKALFVVGFCTAKERLSVHNFLAIMLNKLMKIADEKINKINAEADKKADAIMQDAKDRADKIK